jgi:hypothetical protein
MSADTLGTVALAILALVLWAVYFAICGEPAGAPFIYAEF